jgi:hypothetical protein
MNRRPDSRGHATVDLALSQGPAPLPAAMALAVRLYPWCRTRSITLDGTPLPEGALPTGWTTHDTPNGPLCVVSLHEALAAGDHELDITYDESQR